MCVMHAPINRKTINVSNRDHTKREKTPFDENLLKANPNFVDERIVPKKVQKKGFFAKILQ